MRIEAWLEYFNNACKISNKDNDWKMLNISKYLKGSALTHYVNSCLNISNFDDLCNILIENFLKPNIVNLSDFSQHQLRNNLDEYFHQKLNCGRQLGLSPQLILEGLTDGMPTNIKQLMTINPPTSPTEWLKVATRLMKTQAAKPEPKKQTLAREIQLEKEAREREFQILLRKKEIENLQLKLECLRAKQNTFVTLSQMEQFEETKYLIDTGQNSEQIELDREEEEEVNSENKEILPPVNPFSPISPVTQIPLSTFIATQQKSEELAPIISEVVNKTNVDACEPMPTFTVGNKEIITIRSLASKYPDAIPVPDKTSKSVIHALFQVFGRMGFPRKIYSDKGKSIMSLLTVKFFKKVSIKMSRCSIFPPRGNSMERFRRSVKRILKASCIDAAILFGVKLKRYINKHIKYSTTEKECAAILYAIKKLKGYIDGQTEFYIQTDHNPLVWLKNNAGNNGRLLRWALALQSFNFTIMHKKGKDNLNVDCLSRNSLHAD
ncbi:uncharacterized protein TNCT_460021 [Trichonephila clavata]|uniref:Integrase catalytic domain-containing protein n=2 Tax=Trichonephila clavata TaxID=2740835 RepID=A0A8X6H339_TRICU|nr:uncharacterized protein TNCT_460021 [Trichonephila clavata]